MNNHSNSSSGSGSGSGSGIQPILCEVCQNGAHHPSDCPELAAPLKDGFYSGGGGQQSHDHDDDESSAKTI